MKCHEPTPPCPATVHHVPSRILQFLKKYEKISKKEFNIKKVNPELFRKFTERDYNLYPNIFIDKILKKEIQNKNNLKNNKPYLISEKEFDELFIDLEETQKNQELFISKIENFITDKYFSSDYCYRIFDLKLDNELKKFLILLIFPNLNDPQNIENILAHIDSYEMQTEAREYIFNLCNYYFEKPGEKFKRNDCNCCIIY